ncbi:unnamed protein product [Ranitomeya imitator]|uniref:ubiquitinyl hydrolase 1 n=1 Tax=Ranitomeya imitator TaxID=111125 RepID=A0ABN9M2A6_9NEOB|nr:unnamed protein product [Ranitomeya imitator]
MLAKFTETEALEGKIYACDECNSVLCSALLRAEDSTAVRRRRKGQRPGACALQYFVCPQQGRAKYACAGAVAEDQKKTSCNEDGRRRSGPETPIRPDQQRDRPWSENSVAVLYNWWSGRNHREKIGVHVQFGQMLNMEPYCCRESTTILKPDSFIYDLSAVVMHHGKGFGSGHYTAFCYNPEGGFWVHCNDSKLHTCSVEEVCKAQAYIIFYTQRVTQENGHLSNRPLGRGTPSISPPSTPS